MNQVGYGASGAGLDVRNVFTINSQISVKSGKVLKERCVAVEVKREPQPP